MNPLWLLRGAGLLLTLAGLLLSVRTVVRTPEALALGRRKATELTALRRLQAQAASDQAALAAFAALARPHPVPLQELLARHLGGVKADVRAQATRPAAPGWSLRTAEVQLEEAPLGALAGWLTAAAAQRPPWRLTALSLSASERTPGAVRVSARLEALDREGEAGRR